MVTYNKLRNKGKNFEIVFVSSDRSETSFTEYYASMPGWFALPYKDKRCIPLTRLFGVEGRMLAFSQPSTLVICLSTDGIFTGIVTGWLGS